MVTAGQKLTSTHPYNGQLGDKPMLWPKLKYIRKYPETGILTGLLAGVTLWAVYHSVRCAVTNPDVTWKTQEPWNYVKPTERHKLMSPLTDYSKLTVPKDRPVF